MYHVSYAWPLVLASLLVAVLAAYTALDLAARISTARSTQARAWWLGGGALCMGVGIWSMHFVGMLAATLPVPVAYDPGLTLLSLLIAIAASGFALYLVSGADLTRVRLGVGALGMGGGVAAMHYTGMAAMRMSPFIAYDPWLVLLSVVIAIGASGTALWIAFRLRGRTHHIVRLRAGSAGVMGMAIAGMHYTGMAAAGFPDGSLCGVLPGGWSGQGLAPLVITAAVAVLAAAIVLSMLDRRFESRSDLLQSSLSQAHGEIAFLALHDALTKLPNRLHLERRLEQAMRESRRSARACAVLFIDLDGFKAVNDAFGHQAGDRLLSLIGQCLREAMRPGDTAARIGGDEFVVVAEGVRREDADALAARLGSALRQEFEVDGHRLRISASIGIALYPEDGRSAQDLISHADAAMYRAKAGGRDAHHFFDPSMLVNAQENLQLLADLRGALARGEFRLHYQPKLDLRSGRAVGAEALLRWASPTRGNVPPDRFLDLAEQAGLIVPIGDWVLDEACRQAAAWRAAGHAHWSVAVNLSALQFDHPGLVQSVRDALRRHALPPRALVLEVTESTAMRNVEASMSILKQFEAMGVGISIDDFGTGYSSLLYLKRLPATELKVDRGFIRDVQHDADDAAIVSAIVALAQRLQLRVVAEGVETPAQQDYLKQLHCDQAQGFLFSEPVPAADFARVVARAEAHLRESDDLRAVNVA
ncbi:EAL domain-containing protein [Thiomonas sp.]|jgi:diguanylate cyclase (GGDEF)-like protein|uniref:putative bifunctional diguanylate cyclase/phosphodiesterase n=1 Tax=Thiomonas sp. TaxID=2047785 RepID=UPI00260B8E4B|nr:EAL domain-containing protein [Thiomonas sp.]